jgi:hypothetical protein
MGADEVLAGTIDLRFSGEGLAPGQVNVAYGQVEPENPASAAVARRAGFTPSKPTHGKDGTRFDWYIRDLHTFLITATRGLESVGILGARAPACHRLPGRRPGRSRRPTAAPVGVISRRR